MRGKLFVIGFVLLCLSGSVVAQDAAVEALEPPV